MEENKPIFYSKEIVEAMRGPVCECGEPIRLCNLIPKSKIDSEGIPTGETTPPSCPKCKKEYDFPETEEDYCECCGRAY